MRPLAQKSQLITEEIEGECIVYDTRCKKAHSLNSILTWIWHHCDGSTEVSEIASQFQREFDCSDSLCLVKSGIEQLEAANLLVPTILQTTSNVTLTEQAMSRRSITAASALYPVIASILVPTAAAAMSGTFRRHHHEPWW